MDGLRPIDDIVTLDGEIALGTELLARVFQFCIACLAQRHSPLVLDKADVSQFLVAEDTLEALRVPGGSHGTDHTANDEVTTSRTGWCKEGLEIVFTVLPSIMLEEDSLGERLETLNAHEASVDRKSVV